MLIRLVVLAAELWSLLTLNSGSQEPETSPLASQSLLLLLVLINHCTTSKNVFRDALSSHNGMYFSVCAIIECDLLNAYNGKLLWYPQK